MVANRSARVDWAMAEALAFGTLMLHRGVRPPGYPTPQSLADPPLLPADRQPPGAEVCCVRAGGSLQLAYKLQHKMQVCTHPQMYINCVRVFLEAAQRHQSDVPCHVPLACQRC